MSDRVDENGTAHFDAASARKANVMLRESDHRDRMVEALLICLERCRIVLEFSEEWALDLSKEEIADRQTKAMSEAITVLHAARSELGIKEDETFYTRVRDPKVVFDHSRKGYVTRA